ADRVLGIVLSLRAQEGFDVPPGQVADGRGPEFREQVQSVGFTIAFYRSRLDTRFVVPQGLLGKLPIRDAAREGRGRPRLPRQRLLRGVLLGGLPGRKNLLDTVPICIFVVDGPPLPPPLPAIRNLH